MLEIICIISLKHDGTNRGIFICQHKYVREVLERFGMEDSKAVGNPIVPGHRMTKEGEGK